MDLKPKRPLEIDVHVDGSIVTVSLTGYLTFDSDCGSLRRTIDTLLDQGHRDFVLDLRDIRLIDSAGLAVIIRMHSIVKSRGGLLLKADGHGRFLNIFKISESD